VNDAVIRLRGLTRLFGGIAAVRDVDLDVAPGERRAVLGPNGAGKTTLFNLIAGDQAPTAGTVELFGRDVTGLPVHRRARLGLARTYQAPLLFAGLTVSETLELAAIGPRGGRFSFARRAPARAELAERVGLAGRENAQVATLSHGELRQLELGAALAAQPRVLLLDEPAAGLSPGERERLTELLRALDPELTLLLVEHDMDVALTVAQRVTMMHDGAVVLEGSPEEIRSSELVEDLYLGSVGA
jgi:branched-chain amino acid transport system ATP-binding protein